MESRVEQFSAETLRQVGLVLFRALGASREEAAIVVNELIEASLMGVDSHGVMRYVQYAEEIWSGQIKPGAVVEIVRQTPSTAVVDCGFNFGAVGAHRMIPVVCGKAARTGVACVVSRNSNHVGRLGSWVERIASHNMLGLATVNVSKSKHAVAPFGGREARLGTNAIAWAAPSSGRPIVFDASTAMISEGQLRLCAHTGQPVPEGRILDAAGHPTTDPRAFYGPPPGAILPFGMPLGHKGYGLGLLVEVLGACLAGVAVGEETAQRNGLCLIAISPDAFISADQFRRLIEDLRAYVTSSAPAPGYEEVLMPGDLEQRTRARRLVEGIPVPIEIWDRILAVARQAGAKLPLTS
ncbi:MAG: Ldh family oxidoreductase [Anaerolineae bacterium]|nr:Ldh family oxidoreductase [Thermoflexales bacterium]MDW8407284.1 Ldh family oxidoreductase [Anaerolineae bacterium]